MDRKVLERLERLQALTPTKDGQRGVRVSLHLKAVPPDPSRPARLKFLEEFFQRIAENLKPLGAELDLGSLSVSGQVLEGTLPLAHLDKIEEDLERQGVRLDLLVERNALL